MLVEHSSSKDCFSVYAYCFSTVVSFIILLNLYCQINRY
jgi:hypothetical protein